MKDEEKIVEEYGFDDVSLDTSDTPDFTDFIEHVDNIENRPDEAGEAPKRQRAPKKAPVEEEFIPFDPHREIVISPTTKPPKKRKHHG